MSKNEEVRWERINEQYGTETARMKAPGGWLYRTIVPPYGETGANAVAMVFVPEER